MNNKKRVTEFDEERKKKKEIFLERGKKQGLYIEIPVGIQIPLVYMRIGSEQHLDAFGINKIFARLLVFYFYLFLFTF